MQSATSRSSVHLATEIKETEAQSKFFFERVSQIEAYFGDLCTEFINYTRRTAKLRNNGDELSKILLNYSVNEKINRTTARTLKKFAELLSTLEDYRHAEVDRLFAKVVTPLSTYGEEVKKIRSNIKVETAARKKEVSQLKRLSLEPRRRTEERINTVTQDALRTADALERHVIVFEAKKLKGLKDILTDFVHIEMLWHAKALETLTDAFNVVQSMQEEVDLTDFRNTLFRSSTFSSLDVDPFLGPQTTFDPLKSHSTPHLNSSLSSIPTRQEQENLARGRSVTKCSSQETSDDEVEDDDEEDEIYEDDDEDDEEEEEQGEDEESEDQPMTAFVGRKSATFATPLKSALKQPIHAR